MYNNTSKNEFFSVENKHMLWDLMYSNGVFENISQNNYNNVRELFEKQFPQIYNENSGLDLTTLNKYFISSIIDKINNLNQIRQQIQQPPQNFQSIQNNIELVTSEDLLKKRTSEFEKTLHLKQVEFDDLIEKKLPDSIDFVENCENNNDDLDNILEQTIKKRQQDMNIYFDDSNQVINNNDNNIEIQNNNIQNNNIQNNNIQNNNIQNNNIQNNNINAFKNDKHVSFQDEVIDTNRKSDFDVEKNFLSKLKMTKSSNEKDFKKEKQAKNEKEITIELDNLIKPLISRIDELELKVKNQQEIIDLIKENNKLQDERIKENFENMDERIKENFENMDERIKANKLLIEKLSEFNEEDSIQADTMREILDFKNKKRNEFWNNKVKIGHKNIDD